MLSKTKSFLQYVFGFSYLGVKTIHGVSKKGIQLLYDRLVVVLPFLSQPELLGWSKNLSNGVETIYDKAMDAEYIKSHIGGAYHRLFDGGHSPVNAWDKVKNASETDTFSQEVIGYVSAMWKDATTKMGMPFTTFDKSQYDKIVDSINASTGIDKKWMFDLSNYDVFEIFSSVLGVVAALFFLKKDDINKVSEILGSMGILAILSANVFMGIAVVVQTVYAYTVKKKQLDKKEALKGASYSAITYAIFSVLGFPILIELIIAMVVLKVVKGEQIPGKKFVNMIFEKFQTLFNTAKVV